MHAKHALYQLSYNPVTILIESKHINKNNNLEELSSLTSMLPKIENQLIPYKTFSKELARPKHNTNTITKLKLLQQYLDDEKTVSMSRS